MKNTTYEIRHFLGNDLVGACSLTTHIKPFSLAYFCTTCGDIWGRIVVGDGDDWQSLQVPCEHHLPHNLSDNNSVPGSVIYWMHSERLASGMWWAAVIDFLPRSVLEREFLLRTNFLGGTHGVAA